MKIAFMTLGCPGWDLDMICSRGHEYGYDGVDFRGYLDTIDITQRHEFTTGVIGTRRMLNDAGLEISAISSSITVCVSEKLKSNLDEARRTIAVAEGLGARNIRIFGGGDPQAEARDLAAIGRDCIESILALDGAQNLHWLFETHDRWGDAAGIRLLLDAIPNAAFGALWDIGNTCFAAKETPEDTLNALRGRIGYTHIKDAIYDPQHPLAMKDGWHYVSPGSGQFPLVEMINKLKATGYDGWLQFEHEKRWIPNLPEPEIAFPAFATWARSSFL